ncbi:hypothetical protein H6G97_41320 [Nostoc flagelliforme FACHB-838]|uniref:Uncharacterized protein n=1 Tax=Nostoc flagelliforme FACHB-838 TaxID=2692904 RepID=A0ABR8E1M5_9NOSO|nr:hypothetical protein [Nostoc flagelliforme]MBD2535491.1 hypothetical protein [Nostoc flagelliforme FACHB-838]
MQPYKFSYPEHERIHRRLYTLVGPGAAAFYKDACRLIEMDNPLESTTHIVGHLLRETESSLRSVLRSILVQTESKKKSNNDTQKNEIVAILKALEIPETFAAGEIWFKLAGKENEDALHKRAHRNDLAPPRNIDENFESFWRQINEFLDAVLDKFETRASIIRGNLDKLFIKIEPSNQDIDYLRLKIPNSAFALGYFFEHLEFPTWLKPLRKAGFFANPPGMETDAYSGSFSFPAWPQSRYLIKVASHEPETVLKISKQLLDLGSNNISIYEDLSEAALEMPPNLAALWVKQAIGWLKQQTYLDVQLPDTFGKIIVYLTLGNQADTAIELTRELLAVLPNNLDTVSLGRPVIRVDEHYYNKILSEYLPILSEHQPNAVLTLLCDLLERYLSLSSFLVREGQINEDHSYYWSPRLNRSLDNSYGIKSYLIASILDVIKRILELDKTKARDLLQKLQSYHWRIFDRVAIYLLQQFPEQASDIIVARLTERDRFEWLGNRFNYSHEHARLLQQQFKNLPGEAQNQIFQWLAEGPFALEVEEEKRDSYIKHWQRDWLSIIRDYISPELRQLYDQLVEEIGAPISLDSVDFGYSYTVQIGSDSPRTGAELVQMAQDNIHGLITYLREWEPSENLREKSRNDLAWELAEQVITPNPESFVSQIESFKELDPVFMVWLLRGLKKALENPPSEQPLFSWQPVINFCTWMHENLHEISNNSTSSGYSDWSRICDAIIKLIKAGLLANESNKIPLTHGSQVWKLLESTINDPQVTPGFTPQYQGSNMSAYEASYNTVRGKAMQAVVDYTLWIRRDANGNPTSQDFNDLPQVQQILEQHLDPQQDPSSAIRAVYGNRFPHLYNLASEWALDNIDQIFPESPELQWMFEAAWEAYIHNEVFLDIFSVLRKKYNHAIEQLSVRNPTSRQQSEAGQAFSGHLVCLFLWKEIDITESDGLLQKFFANASADLHQEFMRQISWKLLYGNLKLNEELRQRLQKLIEWRIAEANNSTFPLEQASDLKYFSWWFASGQFDNQWAIAKLLDVLKILKTVHHTSNFFESLERLASTLPQDVVRCLCVMADSNKAREWFLTYPAHCHNILKAVLQSKDEAVQRLARDLINRLLPRNLGDYRDLLS